jgi:hypothetical protein
MQRTGQPGALAPQGRIGTVEGVDGAPQVRRRRVEPGSGGCHLAAEAVVPHREDGESGECDTECDDEDGHCGGL